MGVDPLDPLVGGCGSTGGWVGIHRWVCGYHWWVGGIHWWVGGDSLVGGCVGGDPLLGGWVFGDPLVCVWESTG